MEQIHICFINREFNCRKRERERSTWRTSECPIENSRPMSASTLPQGRLLKFSYISLIYIYIYIYRAKLYN